MFWSPNHKLRQGFKNINLGGNWIVMTLESQPWIPQNEYHLSHLSCMRFQNRFFPVIFSLVVIPNSPPTVHFISCNIYDKIPHEKKRKKKKKRWVGVPFLNFLMISHQGLSKFYYHHFPMGALLSSVWVLLNPTRCAPTPYCIQALPALKAGHGSKHLLHHANQPNYFNYIYR